MRIASIEVMRAIAIFCVVLMHTQPFLKSEQIKDNWYYVGHIIQILSCFAVPFFFVAAGYFFTRGIEKDGLFIRSKKYLKRLALILVAWIFIDGLFWGAWIDAILEHNSLKPLIWNFLAIPSFAIKRPDLFFFRGTAGSLWFLVSLIIAIVMLSVCIKYSINKRIVLVFGLIGYLFALSTSSYSSTSVGLGFTMLLEHRGPFYAFFFTVVGYLMANTNYRGNGVNLLVCSIFLKFLETTILSVFLNEPFRDRGFLLSTPLVAIGTLLVALRFPSIGKDTFLHKVGSSSLGIYVIHSPVLGALNYYREYFINPIWEIAFPIIAFLVSYYLVILIKRVPYFKRIVS